MGGAKDLVTEPKLGTPPKVSKDRRQAASLDRGARRSKAAAKNIMAL